MSLCDKLKKTPEQEAKYQARIAVIKAKQEERRAARATANTVGLVMPLNDRGEKLLAENLSKD